MAFFRETTVAIAVLIVLTAVGCGSGNPETYPVEGKVAFPDGTPLPGGVIEFQLVESPGTAAGSKGRNARATVGVDGTFSLSTFEADDGALPGRHRVLVRAFQPEVKPWQKPPRRILAPRHEQFDTSGLECEVKEESNQFTFTVYRR